MPPYHFVRLRDGRLWSFGDWGWGETLGVVKGMCFEVAGLQELDSKLSYSLHDPVHISLSELQNSLPPRWEKNKMII
jgi:hypothetical protein